MSIWRHVTKLAKIEEKVDERQRQKSCDFERLHFLQIFIIKFRWCPFDIDVVLPNIYWRCSDYAYLGINEIIITGICTINHKFST